MFKNISSTIENIEIFPIVVMILFFAVFITIIWRTLKMKKKDADEASKIPLDENKVYTKGDSNGRN